MSGSTSNDYLTENRYYFWWPLVSIVVLVVIIYANTVSQPYHYDDLNNIVFNEGINQVKTFFDFQTILRSRSLGLFSFALDRAIYGNTPVGHHLTNIFIHILASLFVWRLGLGKTSLK